MSALTNPWFWIGVGLGISSFWIIVGVCYLISRWWGWSE